MDDQLLQPRKTGHRADHNNRRRFHPCPDRKRDKKQQQAGHLVADRMQHGKLVIYYKYLCFSIFATRI